jgi:prevent-host-death family protein
MATLIPVRELRNHTADVVARVQAGEIIHVTVHGRPALELRPIEDDPTAWLDELLASPAVDTGWLDALEAEKETGLTAETTADPWGWSSTPVP